MDISKHLRFVQQYFKLTSMPTKEPEDLREVILNECHWKFVNEKGVSSVHTKEFPRAYVEQAKIAMDEWGSQMTLDAFSFLAKHNVQCEVTKEGEEVFYYKEELISKEELFQNFL